MNRLLVILGLVSVVSLDACRPVSPPAGKGNVTDEPVPKLTVAQARREPAMTIRTLEAGLVASTIRDGGSIAAVRVESSEIQHGGTRSESVRISSDLVECVHGALPAKLVLQRYTHGGDRILVPGRLYVVAALPSPRYAPGQQLMGFVEVSESQLAESVKAHRTLIPGGDR